MAASWWISGYIIEDGNHLADNRHHCSNHPIILLLNLPVVAMFSNDYFAPVVDYINVIASVQTGFCMQEE
jgi:hypothetical protein